MRGQARHGRISSSASVLQWGLLTHPHQSSLRISMPSRTCVSEQRGKHGEERRRRRALRVRRCASKAAIVDDGSVKRRSSGPVVHGRACDQKTLRKRRRACSTSRTRQDTTASEEPRKRSQWYSVWQGGLWYTRSRAEGQLHCDGCCRRHASTADELASFCADIVAKVKAVVGDPLAIVDDEHLHAVVVRQVRKQLGRDEKVPGARRGM